MFRRRSKHHRDPKRPVEAYLGDVVDMQRQPFVRRKPPSDYHWAKRAAVVVGGTLIVFYGMILWVTV